MPRRLLPDRVPVPVKRRSTAYALTLLICLATFMFRFLIDPWVPLQITYAMVIIFPAVIISAYLFGLAPGIFAAMLTGCFGWYCLAPPYNSFELAKGGALSLIFYAVVVGVDLLLIHSMQMANKRLHEEREHSLHLAEERGELARRSQLLFDELQHRVGNNLQMIGAVLGLQQVAATDPAARSALANAGSKLELIGRIQRRLYNSDGEHLKLDTYLHALVTDLVSASGKSAVACRFEMDRGIDLPVDNAIALALIVAEAVANAIEHGFRNKQAGGTIDVGLARRQGAIEVRVRDNGVGLPDSFHQTATHSLGIEILRTLARQLGGEVEFSNANPGTSVTLRMPATVRQIRPLQSMAA